MILNMEALSVSLGDLGLFLVQIEGWLLIQKTCFDIYLEGEPYQFLQVYANPATKKYLVRVFGRTVKAGNWNSVNDMRRLCESYFVSTKICTGNLEPCTGFNEVNFPFARWISESCSVMYSKLDGDNETVGVCAACSNTDLSMAKATDQGKSPAVDDDVEMEVSLTFGDVGDHEEDENAAPSDEDWEWPAERTERSKIKSTYKPSPQSQHELTGDNIDSKSMMPEVEHEPLNNGSEPPEKAKVPKLQKRTILGQCPICNKELRSKTNNTFRRHMNGVHFRGRYTCEVCSDVKRFPVEIAEHVLYHHPGRDYVKCKRCNQKINIGENPHIFENHVR